jgi:zinc protease
LVDVEKLVADYRGKDATAAGEAFDPSAANIEKRTKRYALANGMQVAELPKQTRGNTVAGTILINTGDLASLTGKKWVAEIAGRMLQRGAGNLSREQIADRLAELKATSRCSLRPTTSPSFRDQARTSWANSSI